MGHGDSRIHIIPTLSSRSVKNGGKLTISAVIKAVAGVREVKAELRDDTHAIDTLTLTPTQPAGFSGSAGILPASSSGSLASTTSLWSCEWTAHDLQEKNYCVSLRVTDASDHQFEDDSLQSSDPIAGIDTAGTTDYPNGGMRLVGTATDLIGEAYPTSAVIDTANGFAYFGTGTSPGMVVKVALGAGSNPPVRVGTLELNAGEDQLTSAIIDTAHGYAYFGTNTSPGIIIKVALGSGSNSPTRVGAVTLSAGENDLSSAVIDPPNGYGYFGTNTTPGIVVKVKLGESNTPPSRIAGLSLNQGEDKLRCGVIDPTNGYAYFGSYAPVGIVIKVSLGIGENPPARAGALTLASGEGALQSAVIDPSAGYAYFGATSGYFEGAIVKVLLGAGPTPPARVGAVKLAQEEQYFASAAIDAANGFAYFGSYTFPFGCPSPGAFVVKIALGSGAGLPTRVGSLPLSYPSSCVPIPLCAVADPGNGYAYFGIDTRPGIVCKIALGTGATPPSSPGSLKLYAGEDYLVSGVIDSENRYAYFVNPGIVVKVSLGEDDNPPRRVGAVTLNAGEHDLVSGVIDPWNGYGYFGTNTTPGIVVKVKLGTGDSPPVRVGALTLNMGENDLVSAVIDSAHGYAYWGGANPGVVVQVGLGEGDAPPTRIGAVTLGPGENSPQSAVIDSTGGFAYFGAGNNVVKLALGDGSSPLTLVGAALLNSGETGLSNAVIDAKNGYAYFGTGLLGTTGIVIKVALGTASNSPVRVGALTLNSGEGSIESAAMFSDTDYAYFMSSPYPNASHVSYVVKVALGAGDSPPTHAGAVTIDSGESYPEGALTNDTSGYLYAGTHTAPGIVVKVHASQKGYVKATKTTVNEAAALSSAAFYSHNPGGSTRLSIFDNSASRTLLWQSPGIPNTASNDWLTIPISSGTPPALTLQPGTYWLAWQVDTNADVPSYTKGNFADGFYLAQPYGPFPDQLTGGTSPTLTDETWSEFISYDPAVDNAHILSTSIPPRLAPNVSFSAGITLQNTGNTVWPTDGTYLLKTIMDDCSLIQNSIDHPEGIAPTSPAYPSQPYQFIANIKSPPTEQTCHLQFQMLGPNSTSLGDSFNTTILIAQPPNTTRDWTDFD